MQVLEQEDGFRVETAPHIVGVQYLKRKDGWTFKLAEKFATLTEDLWDRAFSDGVRSVDE